MNSQAILVISSPWMKSGRYAEGMKASQYASKVSSTLWSWSWYNPEECKNTLLKTRTNKSLLIGMPCSGLSAVSDAKIPYHPIKSRGNNKSMCLVLCKGLSMCHLILFYCFQETRETAIWFPFKAHGPRFSILMYLNRSIKTRWPAEFPELSANHVTFYSILENCCGHFTFGAEWFSS